jgi:hypothetical protein
MLTYLRSVHRAVHVKAPQGSVCTTRQHIERYILLCVFRRRQLRAVEQMRIHPWGTSEYEAVPDPLPSARNISSDSMERLSDLQ